MSSWSNNRKKLIGGITIVILAAIIFVPAFFFFYKPASCFDGLRNGNEIGVDCGGSCVKLCPSAFKAPDIAWTRLEEVAPGLYNVATYINNPNPNAGASNVPYQVILYDNNVGEITEYQGYLTIPPHRNTLAFKGAVSTGKRIPVRALFRFIDAPQWTVQTDPLANVAVGDKKYSEDGAGSTLSVTLKNIGVNPIRNFTVYAILYDKDNNTLGFSRTVIDGIDSYGSVVAPFTWPTVWNGQVISEDILIVAE